VTYDDTQVIASGEPLWKYMRIALQSGAMPLPPVQIDAAERDQLLAWFEAGAPPRSAADLCSDTSTDDAEAGADIDGGALYPSSDEGGPDTDGADAGDAVTNDAPTSDELAGEAAAINDAAVCADIDACATDGDDAQSE
jgi:hypothetical protein